VAKIPKEKPVKDDIAYKMQVLEETLLLSKKDNTKVLKILEKAYKTTRVMQDDEIKDLINQAYNEIITSDMEV
jgi:uncharacterized protein HemY